MVEIKIKYLFIRVMKVLEMKNNNQSTLFKFFKVGSGEENKLPPVLELPKLKLVEDMDIVECIDLPNLENVPLVENALSVQDNMKLWTILGFLEDHARGFLSSRIILPDLGNSRE